MLGREIEAGDTTAKINQLKHAINKYDTIHHMMSFYSKDSRKKKKKRGNDGDQGSGGGAEGAGSTDYVELGAHGYEVEPREVVDENGFVIMKSLSNVRQPLSTYAPR